MQRCHDSELAKMPGSSQGRPALGSFGTSFFGTSGPHEALSLVLLPLNTSFECIACLGQRLAFCGPGPTRRRDRHNHQVAQNFVRIPAHSCHLDLSSWTEAAYRTSWGQVQAAELAPAAMERSFKLLAVFDPAGPKASGSGRGEALILRSSPSWQPL